MAKKRSPASRVAKASMAAKSATIASGEPPELNAALLHNTDIKRKRNSAAAVAAQARRKSKETANVVDLGATRLKQTTLHFSKDFHDIKVEFPGPDREPYVLDLSFLGLAPRLAKPLAEGFRVYGVGKRQKTLVGRRSELQAGFVAFLRERGLLHIGLDEIDRPVWNQFKQWLDTKIDRRNGEPIHPKTRATTFGALVVMLDALKSVPEFSRLARAAFDARPSITWDNVEQRTTARERLSFEALQAIDNAVTKDIDALRVRMEKSERLLQEGHERLATNGDLSDLGTCAAYIAQKYPEGLPQLGVIKESNPELYRYINSSGRKAHRIWTLKAVLYPNARDLVPLVVFLAIESALNPTTLYELEWSGVDFGELLGQPVVRLGGTRWRANEDPVVPISAARIQPVLDLLRRLTKLVRATVSEPLKDRLFLFNRFQGTNPAGRGLGGNDRGINKSDASWHRGLMEFFRDYGLSPFTLSQIRATIGDEIGLREGIVVSSQVLGHQNARTTDTHYVSDGTRWREAESLGKAMLFMERWFRTDGRIDPRRRRLTSRMDRGAATPGFYCFDPYDSPWPMQGKNRLCTAYGRCPSCPLAAADIYDPGAVALYLSLRVAIFGAQGRIGGEAWRARYGRIFIDLDALLKHVPGEIMSAAKRFHITLPTVE